MRTAALLVLTTAQALACAGDGPTSEPLVVTRHSGAEAVSLLGDSLQPAAVADSVRVLYESNWEAARARVDSNPNDADAIIWLGRSTAYLGRYREAVDVFTAGIARHPEDARLYRHRGHRFITLRRFDAATQDLYSAARYIAGRQDEPEPDGIPNDRQRPTSTLQFNVWYHLGLANYLNGDFEKATESLQQALTVASGPDMQVAARYWLYLSLHRLARPDDAGSILDPINREMAVTENKSYHRLLLVYKRLLPVDSLQPPEGGSLVQSATIAYGLGAWHLIGGRKRAAEELFGRVVADDAWAAFGHIAAEAELARSIR
jgi:tetratricopeptide (TPR) repeat protein